MKTNYSATGFYPACVGHTGRLPGVDLVRSIAVLSILANHCIWILGRYHPQFLFECSRIGTDIFMLLSGCLIYRSVRSQSLSYAHFLRRRMLRIYPVYVVAFIATVVLYA